MNAGRLLTTSLRFHWRGNFAVLLGVAVGTAVLTGALLVGDSQRGSLAELARRRLGWIDQALLGSRFFRAELADDLLKADAAERVAPVVLLQGSVSTSSGGRLRSARKVTILGADQRFTPWLDTTERVVFLSPALARTLQVQHDDEVTLHLQKETGVPRETVLGRKDDRSIEKSVTLKVRVLTSETPGAEVSLMPGPEAPRNAFVPLSLLQGQLDLGERVNGLFVGGARPGLQEKMQGKLTLADWDLTLRKPRRGSDYLSLESRRLILEPAVVEAVRQATLDAAPTLVYMINNISDVSRLFSAGAAVLDPALTPLTRVGLAYYGPLQVPYSIVAAVDPNASGSVEKSLRSQVPTWKDGEIVLVDWEGSGLTSAKAVALTWFAPDDHSFKERTQTFRVAGVVPLTGALNDRGLVPQVRGITDRLNLANWDAPFPYDRSRLRQADHEFWRVFLTTPKGYVTLKTGQELWRSRFGDVTSFRLPQLDLAEGEKRLLDKLDPKKGGFLFESVKENALKASSGGTDFALLFLGFSFFLILAALLLVGLLFRLNLDRRAQEVGVLLASGWRLGRIRWLLLLEGGIVAVVGGLLGTVLALVYADWLLGRLRSWWPGGLDSSILQLHATPLSLSLGFVAAFGVSVLTIAWAVFLLGRVPPRALIQGQTADEMTPTTPGRPRWSVRLALGGVVGGLVCLCAAPFVPGHEAQAGTFFGGGMLLLTAGLAVLSAWMRGARHRSFTGGTVAVGRLGVRNASRHPARSLLTAGLLASAAFLLVGVEPFRRQPGQDFLSKDAGSGGFALLAESDLPLFVDLNSEAGRRDVLDKLELRWAEMKLSQSEIRSRRLDAAAVLDKIEVVAFRVREGDDASCLNLYQPRRPKIIGVPNALIDAGGFAFASMVQSSSDSNGWVRLRDNSDREPIPVIGEKNTVAWMLKSGLGKTLGVADWQGNEHSLVIQALLHDSVFQSALLMSENRFLQLFPDEEGYRFFLIRVDPAETTAVKELLETALVDRGFEVTASADRLAAYLAVENMYLSTFQALGGMGLLLGTVGLAVVLLRSVWERRAELALLRALGYRSSTLGWLVLAENGFLLLLGLGLGTLAALAAVAPHVLTSGGNVGWLSLLGTLGLALLIGVAVSSLATATTVRAALVPALRRD